MKVLVTGATGFIGAELCRVLVEQGHEVRAFHRQNSSLRLLGNLPLEKVVGDITRPETVLEAVHKIDVVFHTAGITGESRRLGRMYTVNVEGTRNLLQASRFAGVKRVIFTSSAVALGIPGMPVQPDTRRAKSKVDRNARSGDEIPPSLQLMDENHTWQGRANLWNYGYAKYLAEIEVQRAVGRGLDAVIVNPTLVMGAGDYHRQTSSLVVQVACGRLPALVEGGVNVVHIKDVVAGHLAALERGKTGERYILGGENITISALVETIADAAGVDPPRGVLPTWLVRCLPLPLSMLSPFIRLPVSPGILRLAGRYFYYSIKRAQTVLVLPPPRPAAESAADAVTWFRRIGALQQVKVIQ